VKQPFNANIALALFRKFVGRSQNQIVCATGPLEKRKQLLHHFVPPKKNIPDNIAD
jgi:hypothetical protein